MKRLLLTLAILLAVTPALAIDIAAPTNSSWTAGTTTSFEYYVAMQRTTQCTLDLAGVEIVDSSIDKGFNELIVDNIDPGSYEWSITCENGTATETAGPFSFTNDQGDPALELLQPSGADTTLHVDFIATDDMAPELECLLAVDGNSIDTIMVTNNSHATGIYPVSIGDHWLHVLCQDLAGNDVSEETQFTILPEDGFTLTTHKQSFGLGEPVILSIDAPNDANVSIDICPDASGFVQCLSPLIAGSFPQTVVLPELNQSGDYLVDGVAVTPRGTLVNNTNFTIVNTMSVELDTDEEPKFKERFRIVASAYGGIGDRTYIWNLSNGTVRNTGTNEIDMYYNDSGIFDEYVTVRDSAGNEVIGTIRIEIDELYTIQLTVIDNATGNPIKNASVELVKIGDTYLTTSAGTVVAEFPEGTSKLYVAKKGYRSLYHDIRIDENTTGVKIWLEPQNPAFQVTLKGPDDMAEFAVAEPVTVSFTLAGVSTQAECALYFGRNGTKLFAANQTRNVSDTSLQEFPLSAIVPGSYEYAVECVEGEKISTSSTRTLTVKEEAPAERPASSVIVRDFDKEKELFQAALDSFDRANQDEQELADLLGIKVALRQARRTAGQYGRDLFDIVNRNDLAESEKEREQQQIEQEIDRLLKQTPLGVDVLDSQTLANYVTEEELETFVNQNEQMIQEKIGDVTSAHLKMIMEAQQRYVLRTKLYHAKIVYGDGTEQQISVVTKQLLYGKDKLDSGAENEYLVEVIPKTVAKEDNEITFVSDEYEVLVEDPVIRFPALGELVYYVEKEVSFSELAGAKTVLMPELTDVDMVTGFSVFGEGAIKDLAAKLGIPFAFLLVILVAAFIAYQFGLLDQLKFFGYEIGPKKKKHYLLVLVNEALDTLKTGDYDKALLLYKEIKLSYDTMPIPARNELYEAITELCLELDRSYLSRLVLKMDHALKSDDMDEAVSIFAKIEGTYERLPEDEQRKVVEMVTSMAKRLGVSA